MTNEGGDLDQFLRGQTNHLVYNNGYDIRQKVLTTSLWRKRNPVVPKIGSITALTPTTEFGAGIIANDPRRPPANQGSIYFDESRRIRPNQPAFAVSDHTFSWNAVGNWT